MKQNEIPKKDILSSVENQEKYSTQLYLVRHGETEFNVQRIVQGNSDSPLTEKGIEQVSATREDLKGIDFDAIFSSDLPRAQHTADILRLDKEILIQTSELLRERNYGRFDGKPSGDYQESIKNKLLEREKLSEEEQWLHEVDPEVETDEKMMSRFILKLREIAVAYPGKKVLVVSHAGILRTFLIKVGYANRKELPVGSFKNAGYIEVASDGVDFVVKGTKGVVFNK